MKHRKVEQVYYQKAYW